MQKKKIDMAQFCLKYEQIKQNLSPYSRKMIDTFINLFGERIIKVDGIYLRGQILCDLDIMYKNIDKVSNDKLKEDLIKLKNMINNNENYLDLYIKLQLVLGLYPDDFFFNLACDYFYREIYTKIMNDEFVDEYKEEKKKKHRR